MTTELLPDLLEIRNLQQVLWEILGVILAYKQHD